MKSIQAYLRDYFVAGLLALTPIAVTLWFFTAVMRWLEGIFDVQHWTGVNIPGLGVVVSLAVILITGALTHWFVGSWTTAMLNRILRSIPVIGGVYGSLRQIVATFFADNKKLGRAVLVEYPRKGAWAIGFVTRDGIHDDFKKVVEPDIISVFVPTTPNPTSGFLIFVSRKEVRPLEVPVEKAMKIMVSLGMSAEPKEV